MASRSCHSTTPFPIHLYVVIHKCFMSDRACKALAEVPLPEEPRTYDVRSKRSGVPLYTLYHRDHGWRSKEEKAQNQQYPTPSKEKVLEKYLTLMADLGESSACLPSRSVSPASVRRIKRPSLRVKTGLGASRSVIQHSNHDE